MTAQPAFLFAPGAGAGSTSAWMGAWAARLRALGPVTPFDYPYRLLGRKTPDRPEVLVRAHTEAFDEARRATASNVEAPKTGETGAPTAWFLVGKSMGSRIGCHVAVEHPEHVSGVICFGYPLVAAGSGALRDQVLLALAVPVLLVQGTRDPLCPLERLNAVRAGMRGQVHIVEVAGANHSLEIGRKKTDPGAQEAIDAEILEEVRRFVLRCTAPVPLLA